MARLTNFKARAIYEFIIELGLVPKNLITQDIIKLIHQSWERERVFQNLTPSQKNITAAYLSRLSRRNKRRRPQKILDDMQPVNFNSLFDNI